MDGGDYYEAHELPDFDAAQPDGERGHAFELSVAQLVSDGDGQTPKELKRQNARDFLKGFFVALAVMGPLCAGVLFWGYDPLGSGSALGHEVSQTVQNVPIAASGGYTLLSAVADSQGELLALSLIRADADAKRLSFAELPVSAVALDSMRPSPIVEIWAAKGLSGTTAAIEQTLGVRIDGSAALEADDILALVDSLGGFRMSLDRDVAVYAPGGLIEYSKHRGASNFSGNDVKQLLLHAPHEGEELVRLRERVFEAAYSAAAGGELAKEISRFCSRHSDGLQTDINAAGVYSMTSILDAACARGEGALEIVRVDGAYTEGGLFELSERSAEALWERFPKAAISAVEEAHVP